MAERAGGAPGPVGTWKGLDEVGDGERHEAGQAVSQGRDLTLGDDRVSKGLSGRECMTSLSPSI